MSILIKGMEIPPHCGICTLNNGTFCYAVEGKEHESEDIEDYADICERPKWCPLEELSSADASSDLISRQVPRDVMHIIFETLSECGIYGEEATIKVVGTLKRLGRYDLLPPCAK